MPKYKDYPNIIDAINDIAGEVRYILKNREKDKYFDGVVLMYSFIENLLKSMVFVKLLWDKSNRILQTKEAKITREYCKGLDFFRAQQLALSLGLIDLNLYERIDAIRTERNDVIHQFWLYVHRGNRLVLRKKLEKLTGVGLDLLRNYKKLANKVGVLEFMEAKWW